MARNSHIKSEILEVLRTHPEGVTIHQIRTELELDTTEASELSRRVRELRADYVIDGVRRSGQYLYVLKGKRNQVGGEVTPKRSSISQRLRAQIIGAAASRCQMCGRTVSEDHCKLQVDHKIPVSWGGSSDDENLWAICEDCNAGKRNFFASITDERVRGAVLGESVHMRLGELLKAFQGEPVPKHYLQAVAWTHDDWEKRLRELRELGWKYRARRHTEKGRVRVDFVLEHYEPWPVGNPAEVIPKAIREAERAKKGKRRHNGQDA